MKRLMVTEHGGTGNGYTEGCRCVECKRAHSQRIMRQRRQRYGLRVIRARWDGSTYLYADTPGLTHGDASTYNNWGCRCGPCTAANYERCMTYRRRRKLALEEATGEKCGVVQFKPFCEPGDE